LIRKPLYKTTIVIWTEDDPEELELEDLAREATSGCGFCSKQETVKVEDPDGDPEFDCGEFFETTSPDELGEDDDDSNAG
jgi:hypothetical protein